MDDRDENPFAVTSKPLDIMLVRGVTSFRSTSAEFCPFSCWKSILIFFSSHFSFLSTFLFFHCISISFLFFYFLFFFLSLTLLSFLSPRFPQISFHFSSFLFFYWVFSFSSRVFHFLFSSFLRFPPSCPFHLFYFLLPFSRIPAAFDFLLFSRISQIFSLFVLSLVPFFS